MNETERAILRECVLALNQPISDGQSRRHAERAKALLDGLEAPPTTSRSPAVYASGEVPMVGDVVQQINHSGVVDGRIVTAISGSFFVAAGGDKDRAIAEYNLLQRGPKSEGDYEPSEAEVEAALIKFYDLGNGIHSWSENVNSRMRAALKAARACKAD